MTTPTTPAEAVSLPLVAEIWTCQGEIDACRDDGMLGAFDTDHTQGNDHFDIGYVRLETALARESALVAERDALRAATKQFYNLTIADPDVLIRAFTESKREAIIEAGRVLAAALAAPAVEG